MVESKGTGIVGRVVVVLFWGVEKVNLNGPPGRNVNNFTTIAIRQSSNMGKRGGELTLTGFFVLIKNQRTVVDLECDSGGQLVLSINRSTKMNRDG